MSKLIVKNKYTYFNYHIKKLYTAGLVLTGAEVKSIRQKAVTIKNSFVIIKDNEGWVINLFIKNYMNQPGDETRKRKLLLHKNEIQRIQNLIQSSNLALPTTKLLFSNEGFVKLEFAIGQGKLKKDKREQLKQQDVNKKMKTLFKNNRF